jgi:hypothetical protein
VKKRCSWPKCKTLVDDYRWGCSVHWHMLPSNLQQKLKLEMQDAAWEAREWIIRTFGADDRKEYDPAQWEALVQLVRDRDAARARRRARLVSLE